MYYWLEMLPVTDMFLLSVTAVMDGNRCQSPTLIIDNGHGQSSYFIKTKCIRTFSSPSLSDLISGVRQNSTSPRVFTFKPEMFSSKMFAYKFVRVGYSKSRAVDMYVE